MKTITAFLILVAISVLTACAEAGSLAYVPSDDGALYLSAATSAARTAISERKTATVQGATIERQRTQGAQNDQATAIAFQQTQTPLAATAVALNSNLTATSDARTAVFVGNQNTAVAHARETETTQANASATASASQTASANETGTALAKDHATAVTLQTTAPLTALAFELKSQQMSVQIAAVEADAARSRAFWEFMDSIVKLIIAVGSIAAVTMLVIYAAKILDSMAMARRVVETRSGTAMLTILDGRPTAQLLRTGQQLLDIPHEDYFELPAPAAQEAHEIRVRTVSGKTFTMTDQDKSDQDRQRDAVLKFLRASIMYYSSQRMDPHTITRIATWRDLEMSAASWSMAVNLLRPHLVVKEGRGGGTYCGREYPNLVALYVAVGERRADLLYQEDASRAA